MVDGLQDTLFVLNVLYLFEPHDDLLAQDLHGIVFGSGFVLYKIHAAERSSTYTQDQATPVEIQHTTYNK
jgi:hypothetical protein